MRRNARLFFMRTYVIIFLIAAGLPRPAAMAQKKPQELRTFLSQYTGREILLISMSSDSLEFADDDSSRMVGKGRRFIVVRAGDQRKHGGGNHRIASA